MATVFDDAVHRVLFSEVIVCLSAAIPYLLAYSLDLLQALACLAGVGIGGLMGMPLRRLEVAREAVARPFMCVLGVTVATRTLM